MRLLKFVASFRRLAMSVFLVCLAVFAALPVADAAPSRDYLTLLIPDNTAPNSWQVQVWTDTAAEEGIQIRTMTDTAFVALGSSAAGKIAGLILPDSAHIQASDALVAAVKQYVSGGGRLLLTYDAGALTDGGFYPLAGKSRFSDLVGVDYVLYESLRDQVVGFGPIVGDKGRMDNLSLPPGKYLPYGGSLTTPEPTAAFVPSNRFDPGGSALMRSMIAERAERARNRSYDGAGFSFNPLRYDRRVGAASQALAQLCTQRLTGVDTLRKIDDVSAVAGPSGNAWTENTPALTPLTLARSDAAMQVISGYGYGELGYYHYVTTGSFPGKVFLTSPQHGLVAGERSYGAGKLLFVNIPLGFFKAIGTDGALLHGFLTHFARDQVGMPRMSVQPKGVGGLVYNWHVDDGDDIVPGWNYLMRVDFLRNQGPFSVHFTVGPDTVTPGDGRGMNILRNPVVQDVVQGTAGVSYFPTPMGIAHEVGSHGGWNHDIYGLNANENNEASYLPWVQWNFSAIENTTRLPVREYSAPAGNNPAWSIRWVENHGVVGMYTVSNAGAPATREWRNGQRLTNKLWAMPIAPFGKSATFEEFEMNGISDNASAQWLIDLQSFVVNHRSNRLFYNHPPGALAHMGVVSTFVRRAAELQAKGRFKWYTMAQLGDFAERRLKTSWSSSSNAGVSSFEAANPVSLADMTWLLPRSRYGMPMIVGGAGTVSTRDTTHWVVTADAGSRLRFMAWER